MNRTPAEIVEFIKRKRDDDFFGTITGDCMFYVPFADLKSAGILNPEASEEEYNADVAKLTDKELPRTREDMLARIKSYMEFAWGKANNCRGLSANRSIDHMIARLWLLGEEPLFTQVEKVYDENYCMYGKPILRGICEHFGWDWKAWDDGSWVNGESDSGVSPDKVPAAF